MMTTSGDEDDHSRSPSPDDHSGEEDGGGMAEHSDGKEVITSQNGMKPNLKDPFRPRRKKARRACYACQRAHLTCGDERPCQRCIKRGLQDACQDGVRKKAKYLQDTPTEALMPGVGGNLFNHASTLHNNQNVQNSEQSPNQHGHFFQSPPVMNNFSFPQSMPPPALQDNGGNSMHYTSQSAIEPNYTMGSQASMPNPALTHSSSQALPNVPQSWSGPIFDPADPGLFNFDLASMNFGNHYGALEFGMLGHMATAVGDTPPSDTTTQRGSIGHPHFSNSMTSFSGSPNGQQQFLYNDNIMSEWPSSASLYNQPFFGREGPHAFAIESNHPNFSSPEHDSSPAGNLKFEESPTMTTLPFKNSTTSHPLGGQKPHIDSPNDPPQRKPTHISTPQLKAKSQLPVKHTRLARNPASIYTDVTSPYSYTTGFHSLIAYLQRRFAASPSKTLTIAKSLASIRPSFIATTKTLNRDDLIFMEKCFQRTLFEYEGFIEGVGTPTIVARRTGEIAAVGKEFQILTGWKKDVLLGRMPNLNVNKGGESGLNTAAPGSGANTTGRATGVNTPVPRPGVNAENENGEKRLQPVFLAELLDDDSVVKFYEDFARLAFGDSRGSVMGRGKLLKYRTKDDEITQNLKREAESHKDENSGTTNPHPPVRQPSDLGYAKPGSAHQKELKKEGIAGERGMQKLGSKDGKVECAYCWTVKRDVFDIPMLIVMNFLPCI